MARECAYLKCAYLCMFTLAHLGLVVTVGNDGGILGLLHDRDSLLMFKSGVTGDPENSLENWNSSGLHVCNWTGVSCNPAMERVLQLDLRGRALSGVISPALGNLSYLVVLDLSENCFGGGIPLELRGLSRLKQLSLSSNFLEGAIPPELGSLKQLVYLDLGSNQLSGHIPTTLSCNCSSLQYVDLSNNSLSGQIRPDNQCRLAELRFLLLWSNKLIGPIPPALSNSSKLEWLDLENNYLTGELPLETMDRMPYLQFLYLSYNNLLSHSSNSDLDPFFTSLANCRRLQELELAGNGLGGQIPPAIGNLSINLLQFHLEENYISGSIPPNLSNLVNLTYLNLSNNFLNGSIPQDIAHLSRLERLYLSNNLLTGEIPPVFGDMPHLGLLDISGNKLSGSITDTFASLSQLRWLLLHKNNLSGTIPPSLGNCVNLEILDLSHNRLTGTIPEDVAALRSLKLYLNLSSNSLQGSLPLELSKMDMALALDLSSNNLSGMIPPQLGSCVALESLNLSGNHFEGHLPSSIGSLPFLEVLDLSSNQLEGILPESLRASSMLKQLNLSFNNFSGIVPNDGVFASLSADSFIGNSGLCGQILGLSACTNKRVHSFEILPILLTLFGTPCILFFIGYPFIKKSREKRSALPSFRPNVLEDEEKEKTRDYPRISYRQLLKATGGFQVSNMIGSGRFGHVFKGVLLDETRIAVKVLDSKTGGEMLGSFKRECEVLKRTRHRNLIRIITACSKPDFKALVFPLMPNGSLENHLYPRVDAPGHHLDLIRVVNISSDIADGMAYLHHYSPVRVVHCDLKPSNVLLDEDMTALVADFGIARLMKGKDEGRLELGSSPCNSMTELLCGSVGYIAPEYGFGERPSTQGDVYSFGVLLLEMITRKRPTDALFQEGLTLQEWVKIHYPHNLDHIIDQALLNAAHCENEWRDVIIELIELGLVCTQLSPSVRPTMRDVAHEIGQLKQDISRISIQTTVAGSSL